LVAAYASLPSEGPDVRCAFRTWAGTGSRQKDTTLDDALVEDARFYFVHTYAIDPSDPTDAVRHDLRSQFVSGVQRDNITGVQFHPEKAITAALLGAGGDLSAGTCDPAPCPPREHWSRPPVRGAGLRRRSRQRGSND
jgi:hypothetical protein